MMGKRSKKMSQGRKERNRRSLNYHRLDRLKNDMFRIVIIAFQIYRVMVQACFKLELLCYTAIRSHSSTPYKSISGIYLPYELS